MTRFTEEQIEAGRRARELADLLDEWTIDEDGTPYDEDDAINNGMTCRDIREVQVLLRSLSALSVPVEGEVEEIATELHEWAEIKRWPKGASMQHWPKQARNKILRAAALLRALSARHVGEDKALREVATKAVEHWQKPGLSRHEQKHVAVGGLQKIAQALNTIAPPREDK